MLGPFHAAIPRWPLREREDCRYERGSVLGLFATAETTEYSRIAERAGKVRAAGRLRKRLRRIRRNPSNRPSIHNLLIMRAIENGSGLWQTTRMMNELKFPQRLEDRKVMKLMKRIESKQTLARSTQEASHAPKPRPRLAS